MVEAAKFTPDWPERAGTYLNVSDMILSESDNKALDCLPQMLPIRDALDVVGGKWKILILTAIMHGNRRFTEIERSLPHLSPKVLANELKDLEEHQLIERRVHPDHPASVEYVATEYSRSLKTVLLELYNWGVNHRRQLFGGK